MIVAARRKTPMSNNADIIKHDLRAEISRLRSDAKIDLATVKGELRTEIAKTKSELKIEMAERCPRKPKGNSIDEMIFWVAIFSAVGVIGIFIATAVIIAFMLHLSAG